MIPRKVFIVAGEASGDLYAGQVVRALRERSPEMEIRGWGGDEMAAEGAVVTQHYRDLAFMGFWEVLRNLRTIRANLNRCWEEVAAFEPDLFLGVDFPGFNLRIARRAKAHGLRVHHYISPSIWAWRKGRIHGIRASVDRMYLTLPFELPLYDAVGMDARFVGHPLLDVKRRGNPETDADWFAQCGLDASRPIIALLPGSRNQELAHMLPVLCAAAMLLPSGTQAVIAGAPGQPVTAYDGAPFPVLFGQTQRLLAAAQCAWVTSGTATLECALINTPQIIVYKTSGLTYFIAKMVARVRFIGLPNLILNRAVVPELIQAQCTPERLAAATPQLIAPSPERSAQLEAYGELHTLLGSTGASARVAEGILTP